MGKPRTKRKNLQKRRKRRVFAAIAAEIQASDNMQWTPEALEAERMQAEEGQQRTHEQWVAAVSRSAAAFEKHKAILAERQKLVLVLRQQMEQEDPKDDEAKKGLKLTGFGGSRAKWQ